MRINWAIATHVYVSELLHLREAMRNLEVTRCAVLPSSPLLCDANCLCVDSDSGSVWAAAKAGLCCIAGKEVGRELHSILFSTLLKFS